MANYVCMYVFINYNSLRFHDNFTILCYPMPIFYIFCVFYHTLKFHFHFHFVKVIIVLRCIRNMVVKWIIIFIFINMYNIIFNYIMNHHFREFQKFHLVKVRRTTDLPKFFVWWPLAKWPNLRIHYSARTSFIVISYEIKFKIYFWHRLIANVNLIFFSYFFFFFFRNVMFDNKK